MKNDNALREVLKRRSGDLPYGFDRQLMERIMIEAEKKNRKNDLRNLMLVTVVSAVMVAGCLLALNHYFSFNLLKCLSDIQAHLSALKPQPETGVAVALYGYIALIVIVLLAIDHLFRRHLNKSL